MYERFEKILKQRGVTSYRVSKETGISASTITGWKKELYTPKFENLQKLANYFNVPLEYFIAGEG